MNNKANIILSGDHLQLGPVVKSKLAEPILGKRQSNQYYLKILKIFYNAIDDLFEGISLMERLMDHGLYQRDPINHLYNSSYVVQLLSNYRSDPAIIGMANHLFYDNKLKCLNLTRSFNKPIVFINCSGEEKKSKKSRR